MKRALLALAFLGLGAVGNADFADELDREGEEKLARPLRFHMIEISTQVATPAECQRALEHLRMHLEVVMTINTTRDGIPWFRRLCLTAI